jgi:hypothetical protein
MIENETAPTPTTNETQPVRFWGFVRQAGGSLIHAIDALQGPLISKDSVGG